MTNSKAYSIWQNMLSRCQNPRTVNYDRYGGRGIIVCSRWEVFTNFLQDMGEPPEGMTLDRRRNNEGYNKDNCRWATLLEQANNKRNSHWITFEGITLTLAQWARKLGMSRYVLSNRIVSRGWTVARAFTQPLKARTC